MLKNVTSRIPKWTRQQQITGAWQATRDIDLLFPGPKKTSEAKIKKQAIKRPVSVVHMEPRLHKLMAKREVLAKPSKLATRR